MTRNEFWLLNGVSAALVALLFMHHFQARTNNELGRKLTVERASVENARQLQPVLENMARRIASAGEADTKLKVLLTKYDIKVEPRPGTPGGLSNVLPPAKAK